VVKAYSTAYTPYLYVAPYTGAATPAWVFLGLVALPYSQISTLLLLATASAASGTLDFSALAAVDVKYPYTYVLTYKPTENNAATKDLVIDHQLLAFPFPTTTDGSLKTFDVKGDKTIETDVRTVSVLNLITSQGTDDWRQTSGGAVLSQTTTLVRYSSYLSPQ